MKVEMTLNIDEERKGKFLSWFRLFAMQLLMGEDETIVDCKVDGEDFPDLYKAHCHM